MTLRGPGLLILLVAAAAPAAALPAIQSGLLGLGRGETARLTVINLAEPTRVPPNPCVVTLRFLEEDGRPFFRRSGAPLEREARLDAGAAASLALSPATAFSDARLRRRPFRVVVESNPGPPNAGLDSCADIVPTLEIYDTGTGRTLAQHLLRLSRASSTPRGER